MAQNGLKKRGEWSRVNASEPCKICAKRDWCTRTADGKLALCMRIKSEKEAKGGGWFHKLDDPLPVVVPKQAKRLKDVSAVAMRMFNDTLAIGKRKRLAETLGVKEIALHSLRVGIGWDHDGREFSSWPARDADCKIIGITRRYDNGEKKTMAGTSNSGIFVPDRWWMQSGPVCIVEGGSDAASLVSAFVAVLGRPSNIGGAKIIAEYLRRRARGRRAIVIGENDRKADRVGTVPQCPRNCVGCAWCWPGRFGAERVAKALRCEWRIVPPLWKDIRDWYRQDLDFRASFASWLQR